MTHWAILIYISLDLIQTPAVCETTDMRLMHHVVCLFSLLPSFSWYIRCVYLDEWPG